MHPPCSHRCSCRLLRGGGVAKALGLCETGHQSRFVGLKSSIFMFGVVALKKSHSLDILQLTYDRKGDILLPQ